MTFLFDIGRVLLDFDFESSLMRLLPPGTKDASARIARLLERKDEFESGRIDAETYTDWALETLQSKATPDDFQNAWRRIFTPNEAMWQCVRQLAGSGHRLILFSNTNAIHVPWVYQEFPEFSLFDDAILSHLAGSVKPEPEIYQHAIRQCALIPGETLYIDDLPQNAATGRQFGFKTWQYDIHNHTAFEHWLSLEIQS